MHVPLAGDSYRKKAIPIAYGLFPSASPGMRARALALMALAGADPKGKM